MSALFHSVHIVDFILIILVLEILALAAWRSGRFVGLVVAALPGAFLLLALRAALAGADWRWMALCLAASFPAHLADLRRRPP